MNVAFRVDASQEIGTGHFVRCLTLGEALIAGGARVRFVSREAPAHLQAWARAIGVEVHLMPAERAAPDRRLAHAAWLATSQKTDAAATGRALADRQWDWLVIDHYAIDAEWEQVLRGSTARTMVIDDLADRPHLCDLLLDQNYYDDGSARYTGKVPASCRQLLGPAYALLRPEFARARRHARPRAGDAGRVLIFFGGVDAGNLTAMAIEALGRIDVRLKVDVVIGAGHLSRAQIERLCESLGFCLHVQTDDMAGLAAAADIAIGAGGVALWERCCVGLPAITFVAAENHARQVAHAATAGVVHAPSPAEASPEALVLHFQALLASPAWRSVMSTRAMDMVDGNGAARVTGVLLAQRIEVRPAAIEDSERIRVWRNDQSVRAVSRHRDLIDRDQHAAWFDGVRNDVSRRLLIGEAAGEPIGVVRFDLAGATAEVSIYLAPDRQGRGFGPALLGAAEQWLRRECPAIGTLTAEVLGGNARSQRLFTGGGYVQESARFRKQFDQS